MDSQKIKRWVWHYWFLGMPILSLWNYHERPDLAHFLRFVDGVFMTLWALYFTRRRRKDREESRLTPVDVSEPLFILAAFAVVSYRALCAGDPDGLDVAVTMIGSLVSCYDYGAQEA